MNYGSFEKFSKTELPTKKDFHSIPNDEHIMNQDNEHAEYSLEEI